MLRRNNLMRIFCFFTGKNVMFTACAEFGGKYGPFSSDKTLVYNNVITNIGAGYDMTTGVFTSPVTGVYYITFHCHGGTGLSLMKNGELVVAISDEKSGSDAPDNGGNSALLQLNKGDKVFVHLPANSSVWVSGHTTTFSGFLVNQL
ncbi:hypothetical protein L3Q82_016722 [Scortum barcoo]|uniref:Uncharacterized protein n=1 Tax=Scortum barcoo TaxID=214431 RepID=A0ACB8X8F0_9TELE|nr:hypothetical protein L3Q82_016722 [Scortum barcoo]